MILAALIVALFASIFAGTKWSDASTTPGLALDLEGGTQIILTPIASEGQVTDETIQQAINVIRQRVDSSGVTEAEITSQGKNIVVGLPGTPSDETLDLVRKSAQMRFRPVLTYGAPTPVASETPAEEPTEPTAPVTPTSPSDLAQITPEIQAQFDALDCTDPKNLTGGTGDDADAPLVTCADDGTVKYILGPVEIEGTEISNASSGLGTTAQGVSTGQWVVNIEFNAEGTKAFRDTTTRLVALPAPQNAFAMVLDGLVISAPTANVAIQDGKAEISGNFTRESAALLANQLNFGSLPLTFEVQSEQQISATLGSEQLEKGLIAGAIGLLLVVIYSLFQYRALGLVTVASLGIAAVLTLGVILLLSWTIGYRLSLPGVAGIIVAIGITADSFIVYFERIRDELRDGRTLNSAVEKGWDRARRTILASDAVNFLAAVVLYFLAVGGVRGFAFTLGLTTLIDLIVVFMFTHPVMQLLARTKFFANGHPASGLDPRRLGASARYAGRGRVARPGAADTQDAPVSDTSSDEPFGSPTREKVGASVGTATTGEGTRQTIAERRAAARRAAESGSTTTDSSTEGDKNEENL
ncbi:protein translocase subunit SecD [Oerskovia enterophila]|uniref:Protein translocase subunit SecD n=1 Tax=Oerskovia enterophila TaxID=43678 RepID=A0A161YH21_9CELL|nr:protein translocase subunit SecD [Oerskovia enterophila]KZM35368.1 protein translocase subunit SecD [Oerskovia enterophila]